MNKTDRAVLKQRTKIVVDNENTLAGKRETLHSELTQQLPSARSGARCVPGARLAAPGLGSSQTTFEHAKLSGFSGVGPPDATNGSLPDSPRAERRRELYRLREWWRQRSQRPRQARCGRTRVALDATLTRRECWDCEGELRTTASWSGVETCASVWTCPVCSVRVRSDRARAIAALDAWARGQGWQVSMLTLTIRHGLSADLGHMRRRAADAWGRVQRLTAWRELLAGPRVACTAAGAYVANAEGHAAGALFVRALEVTRGAHGWHPHYHILVVSPVALAVEHKHAPGDNEKVSHVIARTRILDDWKHAVRLELGEEYVPDDAHGVDWRCIESGEYIAKLDLAMGYELTDAAGTKRTKDGGRKPAEILRDARAHSFAAADARKRGDHSVAQLHERAQRHDTRLYGDYERATVGARLHTASAGLLAWWQSVADEERDESVITTEALAVPGELYDLLRDIPDALPALATAAEEPDAHDAIATWLRSLGTRAIQTSRRHTSLAGWRVRVDDSRMFDGHQWADAWTSARGSLVD